MTTRHPQSFRLPADLYAEAKAVAASRNETLTHVITEALTRYVKRNAPKEPTE